MKFWMMMFMNAVLIWSHLLLVMNILATLWTLLTYQPVESDYSCFTTSQQCVTHLMFLLDEMECPYYGFQSIMEWARKW
jgi:hypothetical protein